MIYKLKCGCGRSIDVREGLAGSRCQCACGDSVAVPRLSQLRAAISKDAANLVEDVPTPHDTGHDIAFVASVLFIAIVPGLVFPPAFVLIGFLFFWIARFWFVAQVLGEMTLQNALLVFFVPFMPLFFVFKRFDIAWKPFLLSLVGQLTFVIGLILGLALDHLHQST